MRINVYARLLIILGQVIKSWYIDPTHDIVLISPTHNLQTSSSFTTIMYNELHRTFAFAIIRYMRGFSISIENTNHAHQIIIIYTQFQ